MTFTVSVGILPAMPNDLRSVTAMHTHFGALVIAGTFLGVLLAGTAWKLTAAHLITSGNPLAQQIGAGMLVQYG